MISIYPATEQDIPAIHELANKIWPVTYAEILSDQQIDFMLADRYSHESLLQQFKQNIQFLLAENEEHIVGFAAFSDSDDAIYTIHKLYIDQSQHGKGIGRKFIDYIAEIAKTQDAKLLELNVHRNNPAVNFYLKLGFSIYKSVDIRYHIYELNDFILRKSLEFRN